MTEVIEERKVALHFTPTIVAKMYNGTFTIENPKSGEHRTYRLRVPDRGALQGKQIIQMMCGPDNETSFKGFGFVNHNGAITLSVWRRMRGTDFDRHAKILEDIFNNGDKSYYIATCGLRVMSSGKCAICGRKLTVPESIDRGIGPDCWERMM